MSKLHNKILILSSWAPPMPGGPQNMYNIFSQFPREDFCILTSYTSVREAEKSAVPAPWLPCDYYYYDKELFTEGASAVKEKSVSLIPDVKKSFRSRLATFLRAIPLVGFRVYETLGTIALIRHITNATVATIRKTSSTKLMGVSDKGPALIATYLAHRKTKLPYVIHLYDLYRGNNITGFLRYLARWLEGPILKNASVVILTNEGTEEYYQQRYGNSIKTAVLHNATFGESYEKIRTPYDPKPPYKIVFTGHVYWPQEEAVLNLVRAMEQLADLPVILELYIPNPPASITQAIVGKKNITLGSAPQSEMPRIQNSATLLFLPFAWNTPSPDIIATATPGKFTDYLASSRPMLIHAPDYAYVSRYAKQHDLGLVVDTNDIGFLAETVRNFLENPQQGLRYVQNALRIFDANHDAYKNAEKLTKLLNMV